MPGFLSDLTGSFSTSSAQNPTVAIMETAYADAGLDVRYINCEVPPAHLADAVRGAIGMGWLGFNCSIPHKQAILEYLDELAPSASITGAVNTVIIRDGRLTGENTDGQGFVQSLKTIADPAGTNMVIFGAGGAARAIAVESALAGASSITIVNRTADRGQELAALVDSHTSAEAAFAPWTPGFSIPPGTDIAVNATSVGFHPNADATLDVDTSSFTSGMVVADVVANPPMTRWLRAAADAGCTPLTGLGMLVNQALVNARLWTGRTLNADVMHHALEQALEIGEKP
ncbi:MAG: shikimate dehydrogenase [Actinomycetota bacterium]|nr:shikimate dehydrogenase [Actinomycetota bacterium]